MAVLGTDGRRRGRVRVMARAGILGVQRRRHRWLVLMRLVVVVGTGGKRRRHSFRVGHFHVARLAVKGRVEFADRRQGVARGGEVTAVVAVVLGFELRNAVLEVANILDRSLFLLVFLFPHYTLLCGSRVRGARTCRMASLCMSPVQAGIMFFRTANSSFILLRRLLSIRL